MSSGGCPEHNMSEGVNIIKEAIQTEPPGNSVSESRGREPKEGLQHSLGKGLQCVLEMRMLADKRNGRAASGNTLR